MRIAVIAAIAVASSIPCAGAAIAAVAGTDGGTGISLGLGVGESVVVPTATVSDDTRGPDSASRLAPNHRSGDALGAVVGAGVSK